MQNDQVYILAGDECVVSKAGKKTYGLDYFFAGLQQKVIPSLSFFVLSLVSIEKHRSFPISVEQTIRSAEEKAASQAKKAVKRRNQPNRNANAVDQKEARINRKPKWYSTQNSCVFKSC
jgi:hypothetical protein